MRLANIRGRAHIIRGDRALDVEHATGGRFGPGIHDLLDHWDEFQEVAGSIAVDQDGIRFSESDLGPVVPRPRQVFGIALNYQSHADEAAALDLEAPAVPAVFTKFPSCLSGPFDDIAVTTDQIDYEIELVVVIARDVTSRLEIVDGWEAVAGVCVGQDISDRLIQLRSPRQFSIGKSLPTFGPIGPTLVTLDELPDRDDLELICRLNGEEVQRDRTTHMLFPVPHLVAYLSSVVHLYAGDVIFSGTPEGVGLFRGRFLQPGDLLDSEIPGVGRMQQRCAAGSQYELLPDPKTVEA
jgi:2,4-didehydro-3-deoxy-L-rhamnonate hydrolase